LFCVTLIQVSEVWSPLLPFFFKAKPWSARSTQIKLLLKRNHGVPAPHRLSCHFLKERGVSLHHITYPIIITYTFIWPSFSLLCYFCSHFFLSKSFISLHLSVLYTFSLLFLSLPSQSTLKKWSAGHFYTLTN